MRARGDDRWESRHGWATALRLVVFLGPVMFALAIAWVVHLQLPAASDRWQMMGNFAIVTVVSTVVLLLIDRLSRRLLPLVTLLELSMLFPDKAPLRLRVAREAIRRRPIEEQLERLRAIGADPAAAATEILTLVASLSAHDRPTRGHAERVRLFTELLAVEMDLSDRDRDLLRWTAVLHDIGKLSVSAAILNKPGKPSAKEWEVLRAHPLHGAQIAAALLPWLGEWGDVIIQHHERYDGTGYPEGLSGTHISRGARIVSVADAYDVMTAVRSYRRPVSRKAALAELVRYSGTQFDPVVVRAMVAVGVPRLRRAQGALAWVGGIPIVATNTVPAATLARVVGSGALVSGAVAGVAAPVVAVADQPTREVAVAMSVEQGVDPVPVAMNPTKSSPEATSSGKNQSTKEPKQEKPNAGPGGSGSSGSGGQGTQDGGSSGGGSGDGGGTTEVRDPVSGATSTVKNGVQSVTNSVDSVTTTVKDTVDTTTDTVKGVVDSVVDDTTGTVRNIKSGLGL